MQKVFVGLSGGVDSSVSAALLQKACYEVTGVFIRVWQPDFFVCNWKDDRLDAMRVCAKLGIPFRELNLEKEYKKEVVDYMIREYKAGKTPNPDVFCNRFIKFGGFYNWAMKRGADFVATGHYAQIMEHGAHNIKHKRKSSDVPCYMLHAALDSNKDQSYFLWQIRREQLPHILFPVGGMKKPEVRALAKKFGLVTADKKDSQGLCFVGKVDMKEFLSHYIKPKKGKVLDENGEAVGEHDGATFYTIGERVGNTEATRNSLQHGSNTEQRPCYVVGKDMKRNTLTVSHKTHSGELPQARTEVIVKNCNWVLGEPRESKNYSARVRYRQPLQTCRIACSHSRTQTLLFETPQIAAAGQSAVLYDGQVCLGGGIIV